MILFISCRAHDYIAGILYQGLLDMGEEVIGYPYADWMSKGEWDILNIKDDAKRYNEEEILSLIGSGKVKALILNVSNLKYDKDDISKILKAYKGKVIYINGEDEKVTNHWPPCRIDRMYQREVGLKRDYEHNEQPLLMAATEKMLYRGKFREWQDRPIDVFFSGNLSSDSRWGYARTIFENDIFMMKKLKVVWGTDAFVPRNYYWEIMQKSKICLHIRGGGWDCLRLWELYANQTVVFAEKPDIKLPVDFFEDGKEIVFFDRHDLNDKIQSMLNNPQGVKDMTLAGHKKLLEKHMAINRAKTILEGI